MYYKQIPICWKARRVDVSSEENTEREIEIKKGRDKKKQREIDKWSIIDKHLFAGSPGK